MSNYPHSASIASSLSTSPFAVQSNLENLINRSRTHPHARRYSVDIEEPSSPRAIAADILSPSAGQAQSGTAHHGRHSEYRPSTGIGTIREASYDDGAAILLAGDEDDRGERASLISRSKSSKQSRAKNYGATVEPGHRGRKSDGNHVGPGGNSRSRSQARTPPRRDSLQQHMGGTDHALIDAENGMEDEDGRKDESSSGPMSPISTKLSETASLLRSRRMSISTRFADDSSGDEGGDVVRGLAASGGGAMFGGRAGLGLTPTVVGMGGVVGGGMEVDPVEELNAEDLELPVAENGKEVRSWPEALRNEVPLILRISLPIFFTQIAEWSLVLASVISIGHLGTTELAASSLASMTASVSSFSTLQGLGTALDTLLPAAWTSSDPTRVGLWTQRICVVMAVSMIPMFVLWWNIEGILIVLGQEREVAAQASLYLRYLSLGIPGYGGNVVVKKYLQAQNLMIIPTYVLFIAAPTNLLLNYLFVWGPDPVRFGFAGGAIATACSYNLTFLLSAGWALLYGPREAFHPVKMSSVFSKLGTVTSLGLAGTIMVSSEWWAWEACALAASQLGPVSLAAQSVLLSTASTFFQVPASLGIASAVRTGNLLGAGRGWEAKWASRASLILSAIFALINSAILVGARKNWGYLFNSDPEVVGIVADVLPWIAVFQVTDGVAATASAILRSLGLHTTGALINLTSYYIIGLPFGIWIAFSPRYHLGLVGLWVGLSIALGYASIVSAWLVWKADWIRAVERVRERLGLGVEGVGLVGEDGKWADGDREVDGSVEENA